MNQVDPFLSPLAGKAQSDAFLAGSDAANDESKTSFY